MRECLVIYVDAALDKHGRAGCGLAVFVRGRAVYTESFGFSHMGGSAQLEAHVCAGALDLAAARWPYHRVIVRRPRSTVFDEVPVPAPLVANFATWRRSVRFSLISLATIVFSRVTSSPPSARLRRVRFFDPGGRPRLRGAFCCASSGAILSPVIKGNWAQQF